MINDNKNEAENEKQITWMRHKKTQAQAWRYNAKYKTFLCVIMATCIKQHQSNI